MENATKALLIVGAVLISLIIIGVGVGIYSVLNEQAKAHNQRITNTEIQKFNSKFDSYVGEENVTAQEMVTLINLASENNFKVKIVIKEGIYKEYVINSIQNFITKYTSIEEFLKNYNNTTFKCIGVLYSDSGEVEKISFKKN